jgi:hypothetical protein
MLRAPYQLPSLVGWAPPDQLAALTYSFKGRARPSNIKTF